MSVPRTERQREVSGSSTQSFSGSTAWNEQQARPAPQTSTCCAGDQVGLQGTGQPLARGVGKSGRTHCPE